MGGEESKGLAGHAKIQQKYKDCVNLPIIFLTPTLFYFSNIK